MKPIATYITFIVLCFAYGATYQQPDPALCQMQGTETRDSGLFPEEELSLATIYLKSSKTLNVISSVLKKYRFSALLRQT